MNSITKAVAEYTGTRARDWELIGGPDSRCGVDYWLRHKTTKQEAYANDDQGYISVSLSEEI